MGLTKLGYSVDKCVDVNDQKIQWALSKATNRPKPFPYSDAKEICFGKNNKDGEYILMDNGNTGRVVFTSGTFKELTKGVSKISMTSITPFRDFEPIKQAILGKK